MAIHNKIDWPVDRLSELVEQGLTHDQVAEILAQEVDPRISRKLVTKACRRYGVKTQRRGPRAAEGHPEWKGGRRYNKDGYVELYMPDHHTCVALNEVRRQAASGGWYRKDRYVLEHRLVMEQYIGRALLPTEVVHHRNGIKDDNRIENLELFDSNTRHLAETLAGQCPKWTRSGLMRIRAGQVLKWNPELRQRFSLQQIADGLVAIQKELELDAPPSKIEIGHYLSLRGTSLVQAFEKALGLPPQLTAA